MDQPSSSSGHNLTSASPTAKPEIDITETDASKAEWHNNNKVETEQQQSPSFLDKKVIESDSHSTIDSETMRILDQCFTEYIKQHKSLQCLDTTPDTVLRYPAAGEKTPSSSFCKFFVDATSSLSPASSRVRINIKVVEKNKQSPSLLSLSKSISANDNDNHDIREGKVETGHEKYFGSSSSLPRIDPYDQNGSREENGLNEPTKSPNGSRSSLVSTKAQDNRPLESSDFHKSTTRDDQKLTELKAPNLSFSFSSVRSTGSKMSHNTNISMNDQLNENQKEECIGPKTTKISSSTISLRQIESFHEQFVGSLSLLTGMASHNDVGIVDEKKTCADPVAGGGVGFIGNDSVNYAKVGEQIKKCGQKPLETDEGISRDPNPQCCVLAQTTYSETKILPLGSNNTENNNNSRIVNPCSECSDQEPPTSPARLENSGCPKEMEKKINSFITEYIDSLEAEWGIRRSVWLENNKYNPYGKRKKSVYAYETFREYIANAKKFRRINCLQFPFDLPQVVKNNRNPILQDEVLPTRKSSSNTLRKHEAPSQISKFDVVVGRDCSGSVPKSLCTGTTQDNKRHAMPTGSYELEHKKSSINIQTQTDKPDAFEMDEVKVFKTTPSLDLAPFMKQCGDMMDELNNIVEGNTIPTLQQKQDMERVDDIIGKFIQRYIEFLEQEWARRRDCSMQKNKSDNSLYQSFQTFKEAFAAQQVVPQVPIDLPDVDASKKVISDWEDNTWKQQSTTEIAEQKQILNSIVASENVEKVAKLQNTSVNLSADPVIQMCQKSSREDTHVDLKRIPSKPIYEYQACVAGRRVMCKSIEQKTRLDVCWMKLNTVQSYANNLKDLTVIDR